MSSKTGLVAKREFLENVRTKGFWIGILLVPILMVVVILVPRWLESKKDVRTYAVVDESGWLLPAVEERAALPDLEKVFRNALELKRDGDPEFETLPEHLREVTTGLDTVREIAAQELANEPPEEREEKLEEVERQLLSKFAELVSGRPGSGFDNIPLLSAEQKRQAQQGLEAVRDSVRDWWKSLPPEEAKHFADNLSRSRYRRVEAAVDTSAEDPYAALNEQIASDELFAYFVIGKDPVSEPAAGETKDHKYVSKNVTDDSLRDWFERHATAAVREKRLEHESIDKQTAEWIQRPVSFEEKRISKEGEEEEVSSEDKARDFAPMAFAYILWMSVFSIAQMLLTNTIEEKSNRIIEVLLSSVSPLQLMAGKILGIAATGLTMILSWVLAFFLIVKYLPDLLGFDLGMNLTFIVTDPVFVTSFVVYFLLGYLFLASLLVAIGSACDSLKEAQNIMAPVTMILMVPLLAIFFIAQDPNGALARVLSYIPPFTPFVMMNRAGGPPPTHEYVLTTILLIVSLILMFWGAAKIFRIGILMTGKAPTPLEILRWLRYPVGQVPVRKTAETTDATASPRGGP